MKTLMETETPEGWKEINEAPEGFLEINDKAKELCDLLRNQYPLGCLASIKTFDLNSECGPYWTFHIDGTPDKD